MSPLFASTSRSAGSKGIARFESQREAPFLTFPPREEGTLFAVCAGLLRLGPTAADVQAQRGASDDVQMPVGLGLKRVGAEVG